ncbi:MAG: hypothetical protein WC943_00465 [Elusimicrobiota bacterium]|jgi:hypothetical protein
MTKLNATRGFLLALALAPLGGCATTPKSSPGNLTHGGVQLFLKKGVTTQAEVLEKFGAPNIATVDGAGHEVWTYQKHASVSHESSGYATIVLFGGSSSGFEQSSRTMTLIIKFNDTKVVSDFSSMYSSF